ncbi:MAG: MATE family efflux transporter [Bacteroidetes bacterium]|nr:MATE family efflux transporter [Bacteroidota bacterium]
MSETILTSKKTSVFTLLKQAVSGDVKDFTTGSINRAIFLLAVPMILEMVLEALFAIVDIYFVNQQGTDATSTVILTEGSLTILYSVAWGLAMGVTALVARRAGEKNYKEAGDVAAQAIVLASIFSIIISLVGLFFSKQLLHFMGASALVVQEHYQFTQIMLGGNIVIMLLFVNNGIFRGVGDANIAMRTLLIANAINIILDPLLIKGIGPFPKMGVTGAAVSTTIGRSFGVLYQLYYLFNGKALVKLVRKQFRASWAMMKHILDTSWGGMLQFIISSCSWIFLLRIIATFGEGVTAGYGTAIRICIFTILPAWGLANAAATLVGQNLGAGSPDRAEKSVWKTGFMTFCFFALVALIFYFFGEGLMRFFISDTVAIQAGTSCLHILAVGYMFFAYGLIMTQAFNGAGDTKTPTYINLFAFWLIQIPLAYVLSTRTGLGPEGVYVAIGVAETVLAITGIIIFRKGKWKLIKV